MIDVATENLLTLNEAADRLRVSWRTIKNWAESGKLEAAYFGRNVRTSVEALERMQRPAQRSTRPPLPASAKKTRRLLRERFGL